jgi:hypothetical protein
MDALGKYVSKIYHHLDTYLLSAEPTPLRDRRSGARGRGQVGEGHHIGGYTHTWRHFIGLLKKQLCNIIV